MARALVVQHTASEGLGWMQEWLPEAGLDVHPIHPYLGHRVPTVVEGDALIVLGGPMGAMDDDDAPWLPSVRQLLRTAVDDGVPTLGVCLGAQLLAAATGGYVQRGAAGPELGLGTVDVHVPDALLLTGPLPVVQWHFDTITALPDGATLLASSAAYEVQAFRLGEIAYGLQFHVEATVPMVAEWAQHDAAAVRESQGREPAALVAEVAAAEGELVAAGRAIAARFAKLVTG
jgi:GMP synthase-like glutamine amidotransferase